LLIAFPNVDDPPTGEADIVVEQSNQAPQVANGLPFHSLQNEASFELFAI
jgi:hypothetical protein